MTDRPFPSAAEFDAFELQLARDLRDLSAPAVRIVDAAALVAGLSGAFPARSRPTTRMPLSLRRWTAAFGLLLVAGALLASLMLATGRRPSVPPPPPSPSATPAVSPDPSPTETVTAIQPRASRERLVFEYHNDVWVAEPDGSNAVQLTDFVAHGRKVAHPLWDGDTLTYLTNGRGSGPLKVDVIDGIDAAPRTVYVSGSSPANVSSPVPLTVVAPDSRHYAFLTREELVIGSLVAGDSSTVRLAPPAGFQAWDDSDLATLAWDPTGSFVLAGTCTNAQACAKGKFRVHDLFLVPIDGEPIRLSSDAQRAFMAGVAPDGTRIAYVGCQVFETGPKPDCDEPTGYLLGVMDLGGRHPHVIQGPKQSAGIFYSWSPDSSRIAYSFNFSEQTGVFVAATRGAPKPVKIADSGVPGAWSPDGSRLLIYGEPGDGERIYSISADGSDPRPLIGEAGRAEAWTIEWVSLDDGSADPFDIPGR